jgi:hypothetical protein
MSGWRVCASDLKRRRTGKVGVELSAMVLPNNVHAVIATPLPLKAALPLITWWRHVSSRVAHPSRARGARTQLFRFDAKPA